jgi:hypothetical protein
VIKKSVAVGIILLFLFVSIFPMVSSNSSSYNNIIYVNDDGGADYTRIQDALTNLISKDEIIVYNGTSFDNNIVRKKLNRLDIVESSNDFYQNGLINNKDGNSYDELHFYGESNASIYIVTVESSSNISLVDGFYRLTLRSNGTQTTAGSDYGGCWVTNGTVLDGLGSVVSSEGVQIGELRFLGLKFGKIINYTYDNRDYQEYQHNQTMFGLRVNLDKNYTDFTLPPGKWHFIFTALPFDLRQDDVLSNFKVWLNFSEDLEISTSEGGKIYALCYAEYDANLVLSKSWAFEYMVNGKASFDIENTFIYEFILHPRANGFWNVKWNTPEGGKNFNMFMRNGKKYYDKDKVEGCVWDVGKNGHYELSTSYLDYDYVDFYTYTPYFIGFDIKLP